MKLRLMGFLALAVAVMAIAPAAKADAVGISFFYSTTGGATWVPIVACPGVTTCTLTGPIPIGGTTITIGSVSGSSNAPGTVPLSITQTANLTIQGGSVGGSFLLEEIASGFTTPPNVQLFTSQSTSSAPTVNTYTTQTTGMLVAAGNLLNPGAPAVDACSAATAPIVNQLSGNDNAQVACNGVTPYDLVTLMSINAGINSRVDLNTTVSTNAVPEPASMALFGSGLLGLAGVIRRKRAR